VQQFDAVSGFLPHFKVFAACSGGRDRGHETFQISTLNDHIRLYLSIFNVLDRAGFALGKRKVALSDMRILESLIASGDLSRSEVMRHTQNPEFSPLTACRVKLPKSVSSIEEVDRVWFAQRNLDLLRFLLSKLEHQLLAGLRKDYPETDFVIDFDRKAGIGYYPGLCFKVYVNHENLGPVALVDGGFTDWSSKLVQSKKEQLLTSGLGTEHLLCCFGR